jgi:hypothetical protein
VLPLERETMMIIIASQLAIHSDMITDARSVQVRMRRGQDDKTTREGATPALALLLSFTNKT